MINKWYYIILVIVLGIFIAMLPFGFKAKAFSPPPISYGSPVPENAIVEVGYDEWDNLKIEIKADTLLMENEYHTGKNYYYDGSDWVDVSGGFQSYQVSKYWFGSPSWKLSVSDGSSGADWVLYSFQSHTTEQTGDIAKTDYYILFKKISGTLQQYTAPPPFTFSLLDSDEITDYSARIKGQISSVESTSTIMIISFYLGTTTSTEEMMTTPKSWYEVGNNAIKNYLVTWGGLSAGTTYYYIMRVNDEYSAPKSFTTTGTFIPLPEQPTAPTPPSPPEDWNDIGGWFEYLTGYAKYLFDLLMYKLTLTSTTLAENLGNSVKTFINGLKNDFISAPPISYVFQIKNEIDNVSINTTTTYPSMKINTLSKLGNYEFELLPFSTMATSTTTKDIFPMGKTTITIFLWFGFILYIVKRVPNYFNQKSNVR